MRRALGPVCASPRSPRAEDRARRPRSSVIGGRTALLALGALVAACSSGPTPRHGPGAEPRSALSSLPEGSIGRIEVRRIEARPRLTLVSRNGDPSPAIVAAIAADLGSVPSTALAAVIEGRLKAGGFDVDTRADRSALRVRWLPPDASRVAPFLAALAAALRQPIVAGAPELQLAAERIQGLYRNPLDAAELEPVAACTGRLGVVAREPSTDIASAAGARDLEAWRRAALVASRTSIAAVGPATFCLAAATALEQVDGWEIGVPAADTWPTGDTVGVYTSPTLGKRDARVSVALRVGDPHAAVAAAERLGAPDSPMLARLSTLGRPWRAVEVVGAARPRGGCVSVTLEASSQPDATPIEQAAALATAIVRQEIRVELGGPHEPTVVTRQILSAADPREAASRAAWWALAGSIEGSPERSAITLGVAPLSDRPSTAGRPGADPAAQLEPARQRFQAGLERALAAVSGAPVAERRVAVEQGQGELWLLLASPCGVTDEGAQDAGATALAAATAVQAQRSTGAQIEPWITPDGVGVIAHAAIRDPDETPAALARRVADAASRTLAATSMSLETLGEARAATLEHLERTAGRSAAALEAFTGAIAPEHPSWLEPFGVWSRVANGGIEAVRLRWQAIGAGPLRVAVLANADAAQSAAAASAVDRWLAPRVSEPRPCAAPPAMTPRSGRFDVRLPRGTPLAQAILGAPIPPASAAGHEHAQLLALALDGGDGLLAGALRGQTSGARASARILGGARAAALMIDVRAPLDGLEPAVGEVKALLARLGQAGPSEADLTRAAAAMARRERSLRADPRRRLVELWIGRPGGPAARPTLAAWRQWIASAMKESSLVVVEARPE